MTTKQMTLQMIHEILKRSKQNFFNDGISLNTSTDMQEALFAQLCSIDKANYLIAIQIAKGLGLSLKAPIFKLIASAHRQHKKPNFGASAMFKGKKVQIYITDSIMHSTARITIGGKNFGHFSYHLEKDPIYNFHVSQAGLYSLTQNK